MSIDPRHGIDVEKLGALLHEIATAESTQAQLPTYGGTLRAGSQEYYTYIAERLVERGNLATRIWHEDELAAENGRRDRTLAEVTARRNQAAEELRAASLTVRKDCADELRRRAANPRIVTGKGRRDGVLWAAEWLYPAALEAEDEVA